MKKTMIFVALATLAAVSFSCSKEKEVLQKEEINSQEEVQGRPVTLTFNLTDDTKISHPIDGATIKPTWEAGDCIKLTHGTTDELFTLVGEGGTASGTFTCASSTLADAEAYTVVYYKNDRATASASSDWTANYAATADWSEQDGTLANLPEYLTGSATYPEAATLSSGLTYFHIVGTVPAEADGQTFTHGYFRQTGGTFKLLNKAGASESSFIKIVPTSAYALTSGATLDLYIAAKIEGDTNGGGENGLEFRLMNADYDEANTNYFTGTLQNCVLSWTPKTESSYTAGHVYKKSGNMTYQDGIVGATDNSQLFWSAWSDDYIIEPGQVLEQTFINKHADAETNTYYNWTLAISNDIELGSDGYAEYVLLLPNTEKCRNNTFSDYYLDLAPSTWTAKLNGGEIDWDTFNTIMNGATVTMKIDHTKAGSVFVTVTAKNGENTIVTTYSQAVSGKNNIRAFLTCDHNHYVMHSAAISESAKNLESLSTSPCFIYDDNLPLATYFGSSTYNYGEPSVEHTSNSGIQHQLVAHYTDGTSANADASLLESYNSGSLEASTAPNTQVFSVTYNEDNVNLSIPVVKGISKLGDASNLLGYSWVSNGELASGSKVTAHAYLYSYKPLPDNWSCPYIRFIVGTTHYVVRLDNYVENAPEGTTTSDNRDWTGVWNWSVHSNNSTRSKITLQAEYNGSNAIARFAVQYCSDNQIAGKGNYWQKSVLPFGSGQTITSEWNIQRGYIVFVDDDTAETYDWPEVSE